MGENYKKITPKQNNNNLISWILKYRYRYGFSTAVSSILSGILFLKRRSDNLIKIEGIKKNGDLFIFSVYIYKSRTKKEKSKSIIDQGQDVSEKQNSQKHAPRRKLMYLVTITEQTFSWVEVTVYARNMDDIKLLAGTLKQKGLVNEKMEMFVVWSMKGRKIAYSVDSS